MGRSGSGGGGAEKRSPYRSQSSQSWKYDFILLEAATMPSREATNLARIKQSLPLSKARRQQTVGPHAAVSLGEVPDVQDGGERPRAQERVVSPSSLGGWERGRTADKGEAVTEKAVLLGVAGRKLPYIH